MLARFYTRVYSQHAAIQANGTGYSVHISFYGVAILGVGGVGVVAALLWHPIQSACREKYVHRVVVAFRY